MKTKLLVFVVLVVGALQGCSQSYDELIIGKWQSCKKEHRDGSRSRKTDSLDGKAFTEKGEYSYYFNNKPYSNEPYSIREKIIYFGSKPVYEIEKLNETELVLVDLFYYDSPSKSDYREYFKRVDKFPEVIPKETK